MNQVRQGSQCDPTLHATVACTHTAFSPHSEAPQGSLRMRSRSCRWRDRCRMSHGASHAVSAGDILQEHAELDAAGTVVVYQTARANLSASCHYAWASKCTALTSPAPVPAAPAPAAPEPAAPVPAAPEEGVATADDDGATTEEEEVATPKEDTVVEAVSADGPTDRSSRKRKLVRERVRTARHSAAVSRLVRSACLWCDRRSQFM